MPEPKLLEPCGTNAAYERHRRRGETCDVCKKAHTDRERALRRARGVQPRPPAKCGTVSGYQKHLRLGEVPCADCKAAKASYMREFYHRQKQAAEPGSIAEAAALAAA